MATQLNEIVEKFSGLVELHRGSDKVKITRLSSPESENLEDMAALYELPTATTPLGSPGAVIVPSKQAKAAESLFPTTTAILASPNPKLALALIGQTYFPHPLARSTYGNTRIHSTAVVDPSAKIDATAAIGPYVVVGRNVTIGAHALIGPHSVIEAGARIGAHTHIHSLVYIAYDTQIGESCEVLPMSSIGSEGFGYATDRQGHHHRVTHYGRAVLEDRVHIGSGVFLDRGTFRDTLIGEGTKIDNYCHLGHNLVTGKNCLLTAGLITAGSATLGANNFFGGRTSVAGHITVCDNVTAAGVSTIHGDVTKPGAYGGYPFVELKHHLKTLAVLPHLVEMRKNMAKIMKKLGLTDDSNLG